jgi:hypothetical protein
MLQIIYRGSRVVEVLEECPHICSSYMAYASAGKAVKFPLMVARARYLKVFDPCSNQIMCLLKISAQGQ